MAINTNFRVLVVDDDHYTSDTLSVILRQSGFQVANFYDPLLALNDAMQSAPKVLVTAFSMPQMNGFKLANEVKKHSPGCKLVIVSAEVTSVLKEVSNGLRFTLLPKPVHPANLIASIDSSEAEAA